MIIDRQINNQAHLQGVFNERLDHLNDFRRLLADVQLNHNLISQDITVILNERVLDVYSDSYLTERFRIVKRALVSKTPNLEYLTANFEDLTETEEFMPYLVQLTLTDLPRHLAIDDQLLIAGELYTVSKVRPINRLNDSVQEVLIYNERNANGLGYNNLDDGDANLWDGSKQSVGVAVTDLQNRVSLYTINGYLKQLTERPYNCIFDILNQKAVLTNMSQLFTVPFSELVDYSFSEPLLEFQYPVRFGYLSTLNGMFFDVLSWEGTNPVFYESDSVVPGESMFRVERYNDSGFCEGTYLSEAAPLIKSLRFPNISLLLSDPTITGIVEVTTVKNEILLYVLSYDEDGWLCFRRFNVSEYDSNWLCLIVPNDRLLFINPESGYFIVYDIANTVIEEGYLICTNLSIAGYSEDYLFYTSDDHLLHALDLQDFTIVDTPINNTEAIRLQSPVNLTDLTGITFVDSEGTVHTGDPNNIPDSTVIARNVPLTYNFITLQL